MVLTIKGKHGRAATTARNISAKTQRRKGKNEFELGVLGALARGNPICQPTVDKIRTTGKIISNLVLQTTRKEA
jgi:hypothetical protein